MGDPTLKDHVKGEVTFVYYRDGSLWYQAATGFKFPVPIDDIGSATFLAKDKAMLFMRWMRKHMAAIDAQDNGAGDDL